jgi:putative PIN family toxin of toxin-antitoxin system
MKSKKVIIDTNLWISFLITKNYNSFDKLIDEGNISLIFSEELIEEFLTVVKREKFQKYFSNDSINEILTLFDKYGKLIKVETNMNLCRDFKDNFLLNLAVDSNADFLVTGDVDLLVIEKIKTTKIVTFNNFIKILKK